MKHIFLDALKESKAIEAVFEINYDDLFLPSRKEIYSIPRNIIAYMVSQLYRMSVKDVAVLFDKHRTTGYNMIQKGKDTLSIDETGIIDAILSKTLHVISRSQCRRCKHSSPAANSSHHLMCNLYFHALMNRIKVYPPPTGDAHGIANDWFTFPINYDPVWMNGICIYYKAK